ncbi:maintenance of telomere capping protein 1 [Cytidiella melzeri]|nr:maintenance of telomere capping protein 1 [Cytidiella melzeri]
MAGKSKSKQQEALQFLDDLDNLAPPPAAGASSQGAAAPVGGEAEVYAFIDEITQKSSEPPRVTISHVDRPHSRAGTPTLRKSTERVKVGQSAPLLPTGAPPISRSESTSSRISIGSAPRTESHTESPLPATGAPSTWGWGNVWTSATAAIQQAKTVVDGQVKNLPNIPNNEQARKWGEGVLEYAKTAQLEKLGQDFKRVGLSTLTDILNVVAPPISEHEVIKVWLSHDMKGYEGVESLVYRALARILEQVEGGDLIVNRGDESRPKDAGSEKRDFNTVEGLEAALKLAQANLDEVIKNNIQPETTTNLAQNPTTYSYVYLRIQPFTNTLSLPVQDTSSESTPSQTALQFILYLSDPSHQITHSTITQGVPGKWLDLWDDYDWVEDLVVEAIRLGVEVLGQEYIVSRMGWDKKKSAPDESAVSEAVS